MGDQSYYGSSDQYHDISATDYLSYLNSGETSYPVGDRVAAGDGFFPDTLEKDDPQGYWPASGCVTTNGLQSAVLRQSRLSSLDYSDHQAMSSQPNGDFVSPSLLNADTDPDSPFPMEQSTSDKSGTAPYENDTERFSPNERIAILRGHGGAMNPGGSELSKSSLRDRSSKGAQRNNGQTNGSPRSKGKTGSTTSPPGGGESLIQLRTASRKAKRTSASYKPATSPEEERARSSHNQVEKQYRNRLNHQFERLLAILPTPIDESGGIEGEDAARNSDRRLSKVEVLDMARQHIQMLEREASELEQQRQELVSSIGRMTESVRTGEARLGPDVAGI